MIDWTTEWPKIQAIATEYGVDPLFIAAIRQTENGGPGKEFGVLSVAAPTYDSQCHVCCATVRNHLLVRNDANPLGRFAGPLLAKIGYAANWVLLFAQSWAPNNANNDPTRLNKNWFGNCRDTYIKFLGAGAPS